ncbi:ABC transporter substrate-binding protein [Parathalassolituus penaei]|uniref:ABC transporter substrate-binding protein n=1 Tax=Parathalassolituus penaei TaxID=2997323 RepID=A0A9X3E9Z2_9GAMM|nr:ABC transporter substrate-binding protein [Parathalassolituus penaei]MCY0963659.1 ABC transporter substrate-binding protein [Parathalassolituus penaei]
MTFFARATSLFSGKFPARHFLASVTLLMAASLSHSADSIKLGLNYPTTGRYKSEGVQQAQGAQLAIDEINAKGGILGRPLELLTANSAALPDKAVENVGTLASAGATMIFGGATSAEAIAAGKESAKAGLLYFAVQSYANETTEQEGHRHIFRESYNAWMTAKALSMYMNQHLQNKRVFYVTPDYSWGYSTEGSLRKFTNTEDPQTHPHTLVKFPKPRKADLEAALQEASQSGADVLVIIQFADDLATALSIAHEMGLRDKMEIIVPNLSLGIAIQAGPALMEGIVGAVPWCWEVPYKYGYERGQRFVEDYVKAYGQYPDSPAASAYSTVYEYADAVKRAGGTNTDKVINALEDHTYQTVKDPQSWRALDHQNVQSVYVVKMKPRDEVVSNKLRADFFDIMLSIPGSFAVKTPEEWQETREAAGKPLALQ